MDLRKLTRKHVPHQTLVEVLGYDPLTGIFNWIKPPSFRVVAGDEAGHVNPDGYRTITLFGTRYKAHRLAWFYVTGQFPENQIDHINGNRDDNLIDNLRDVTPAQNQQARVKAHSNNKLGIYGVYKTSVGYRSQFVVSGVAHYVGTFATAEEASEAFLNAKEEVHGPA